MRSAERSPARRPTAEGSLPFCETTSEGEKMEHLIAAASVLFHTRRALVPGEAGRLKP